MGMYRIGYEELNEPFKSLLKKLVDKLNKKFGDNLVSVVVYGSVARGDYRDVCDIDLLIIADKLPRGVYNRIKLFEEAEDMIQEDIDSLLDKGFFISFSPILKTSEEARRFSPIYLDMVEDAVILYDVNGFFRNILDRLRSRLEELGAERIWIGRKWYWRLKKNYRFGEEIIIEL